jgi:flagellar protein FlbD
MIHVRKLNGTPIILNADWIQTVEETPDTVITLTNGFKLVVKDTAEEVVEAFKAYKRESLGLKLAPGSKKWSSTGLE